MQQEKCVQAIELLMVYYIISIRMVSVKGLADHKCWYYADGDWYYMKGGKVITETIGVMDFTDKQVAAIVTINETEYAFDNLTGKMLTDRIVKKDVVRGKYEYIEDRDMSLIYVNADGKVVTTKGWI